MVRARRGQASGWKGLAARDRRSWRCPSSLVLLDARGLELDRHAIEGAGLEAVESSSRALVWRQHGMLARRRKLGLAEAVATDRIRLWALALLGSPLATTTAAVCQSAGIPLVGTTGGLWLSGAAAAAASACLWLAFLPPAAYLARVRRSAAAA